MSHDYRTGRVYAVTFSNETLTTDPHDLFGIRASSLSRVKLHSIELGQQATAPGELRQLHVELLRGSTTPLSTSVHITPANIRGWSAAPQSASSAQGPTSTLASTLSATRIHADAFDDAGWCYKPDECATPILDNSQELHVRVSAPATDMSLSGTLIFEEIGQVPHAS